MFSPEAQFSRWFLSGECHVSLSRSHVLSAQNKQSDTGGTPDRSAVEHVSFDSGLLLLGRDIDRLRVLMIRSQVRGSLPCTGHQRGHRQNTMLPPPPCRFAVQMLDFGTFISELRSSLDTITSPSKESVLSSAMMLQATSRQPGGQRYGVT